MTEACIAPCRRRKLGEQNSKVCVGVSQFADHRDVMNRGFATASGIAGRLHQRLLKSFRIADWDKNAFAGMRLQPLAIGGNVAEDWEKAS